MRHTSKFGGNSGLKDRYCIKAKEVSVIDGKLIGKPIDRLAELEERDIAKKPFQPFGTHSYKCSNCWKFIAEEVDDNCDLESEMAEWCPYCGQRIDWSDYEG